MPARSLLRLGTRDSLLARAQSRIVQRALQASDPGLRVELVSMPTRGDRQLDVPLQAVDDPDFFSAELDQALRDGHVDCCVHSLKDLPLEPRAGIVTAAIPPRENPRDVVVFRRDVLALLRAGEALRIGTCSDRRTGAAGAFLRDALPRLADAPIRLDFAPLRGAVDARVARLRLRRGVDGAFDGVVLALAGLSRLWEDRESHAHIAALLDGTRLMVLPLTECPVAPGQGALAVECRSDDLPVRARLATIDDATGARRVRRELALLHAIPRADRNGFAATTLRHAACGTLIYTRGAAGQHLVWQAPPRPSGARAWDGADWVSASDYRAQARIDLGEPQAAFLAHWRALPPGLQLPATTRLWVSGTRSWRRLAARGLWVEGCAEDLGFEAVLPTLRLPVLRLPPLPEWTALTRTDATTSWQDSGVGRVLATYSIEAPGDGHALAAIRARLAQATHFYWGSAAQYHALRHWLPARPHHACGPGKTYRSLRAAGLTELQPFPSRQAWQSWVS
jgi:hydroxymethylbilane synthase